MHLAARRFIEEHTRGKKFKRVVEFGGRNINGTVRDLFDTRSYTAVDIKEGPGVDVVADAAEWRPDNLADCVVCCEVLEHTPEARRIVTNAATVLAAKGVVLLTAACDPRSPHSATDGGELVDGEFYQNVDPADLVEWMTAAGFRDIEVTVLPEGDVQAVGRRCG